MCPQEIELMPMWLKTILVGAVITVFLGMGSWGLLRASVNGDKITELQAGFDKIIEASELAKANEDQISDVKTEYKILLASLNRIEKGIIEIQTQQKTLGLRLGAIQTAQAVVNQKLIDHITIDDHRTEKLQDRMNQHFHK